MSERTSLVSRILPVLIFLCAMAYFLTGSGDSPVFVYDEARNAGCAREMFERADPVVPTFNYELRTDKPPLHYWLMMAAYSVFGVNEFAARFFSAFFGALTLLITFLFARRFFNLQTAIYTILILLASLNLAIEFHLAVPDPYLIFFLTAAHYSFFSFYQTRNLKFLFLMYVATGLAILAKGPVALGFIGLNGLVWLLIKKDFNWKTIREFRLITGIAVVSAIVAPWLIKVGIATDWLWPKGFFFEHNLNRFSGEMEGHGGSFLLTPAFVFIAFLPFSIFIIQSYRKAFRKWQENDLLLFSLIVSLVIIIFFSISSTKLPNYPMPAYPFIAMIIGHYLDINRIKKITLILFINVFIGIALPLTGYIILGRNPGLSGLWPLLYILLIIPITAIIALIINIMKGTPDKIIIVLALGWIVAGLLTFTIVLPEISKNEPVARVVRIMDRTQEVAYYQQFNSAFPFYLQKRMDKLETVAEVDSFFEQNPKGYLISTAKKAKELSTNDLELFFSQKELFEPPTTVVYTYRDSLKLQGQ